MSYTKCQEADDETDGYLEGKREYEEENFGGIESDSYGTALSENQRETKFCRRIVSANISRGHHWKRMSRLSKRRVEKWKGSRKKRGLTC